MDEKDDSQNIHKKGEENKQHGYEFDDLLRLTGGFGCYQIALYSFVCLLSIPTGAQLLVQVFYAASPRFNCVSMPENGTCDPGKCCSSCKKYEFQGPFTSAVSEWDLICDHGHLKAMTQAVFMAGLLVGAIAFGIISDKLGRKISFFLSIGFLATFGTASAVADCLSLFSLLRFFAGAGTIGCLVSRFVYSVEIVVTAYRSYIGIINMLFLSVGGCFLALLAFLMPNWRHVLLVVSAPSFLPLLAWWWIPGSPRWLIAVNKLEEAHEVLMKYAKYNHVTVDPKHLKHVIQEVKKNDDRKSTDKDYGLLDTVRTPKLRKRSLIMFFNWFTNALIFYGLNYNVGNLAGNMYLNFFILIAVDFPSTAFCCYCLQRFGRRLTYSSYMLFGGVACLLALTMPSSKDYQVAVIVFVMMAKFFIISSFNSVFVYTSELYPTVIRSNGVGLCSMIARIGGIIAPYVVLLADFQDLKKTFPLLIFGVLGIAAGVSAFLLPETLTSQMPQTVEQVEAWDEDYNIYCCKKPQPQSPRKRKERSTLDEDTSLV